MTYDQLPEVSQLAMIAWYLQGTTLDWEGAVEAAKCHDYRLSEIPTEDFIERMMTYTESSPPEIDRFTSFDEYHKDYVAREAGRGTPVPNYPATNRWPVLIPASDYLIEDGFHRFHSYVESGHTTIPVIEIQWDNQQKETP